MPRTGVRHFIAACLLVACISLPSVAQVDSPQALVARAARAYEAKDYDTFLVLEKQLWTFAPNDPRTIYNVASGQALTNHPADAVSELDKILTMHLDFAAEKDPDFGSILKTPEWARYQERVAALRKPTGISTVAFTIADKGLVASSIAVDDTSGDDYIGSLRQRKILKRRTGLSMKQI